jgi:hypothetical protein
MATSERAQIEDVLRMAREIATRLGRVPNDGPDLDALAVRLAQAHAFGLVDQLAEIVHGRGSIPYEASSASAAERGVDEDVLH